MLTNLSRVAASVCTLFIGVSTITLLIWFFNLPISTLRFLNDKPQLEEIVRQCLVLSPVQFWLDCSTMPAVISAMLSVGDSVLVALFKLTRNYCHRLNVSRNKLITE